ncbi:folate-binding protein YgfZ [Salinisphaera sp. USBA-960]|uniref:CAF17-like 4Fe-4S cluster assembly/insertion protein YgfZ n=1 Tax=Salinisphaera orenii TaxID=856731 RepID=UPI000DBE389D|nr:folate-binding protein YgfZ [Salifodinibacter halophilus]NNC26066.1 folate-binding protein YgfZ [Salifodinibacter halophilus]
MTDHAIDNPELGALRITGADAVDFLDAQLTVNVSTMSTETFGFAGWCDAQGNTIALFYVAPFDGGFHLFSSTDLLDGLIQRLRMFVLRARVEITDLRASHRVTAHMHSDAPPAGTQRAASNWVVLGLATTDHSPLALVLSPHESEHELTEAFSTATDWFQLARVDAGVPIITTATRAMFVSQMLNLHWLGALDFDKGCFPGQEVIARLQNRGRLTQRIFRLSWRGTRPNAGDEVTNADGKVRGTVVRVAGLPGAESTEGRLLAVLKTGAVDAPSLAIGDTELTPLALPYATPADVRPA